MSGATQPSVADVVGRTIAAQGVRDAFGILGSGNLIVTNALCSQGARFHHARHEGGAICMADGYARVTNGIGICSVHQGPGLTNTLTGLTEAAKSRTPHPRSGGRDAGRRAHVELQDRPARPRRIGRGDRRPRVRPEDGRRRCPARLPACPDRAPPRRADAADRHPAATGGHDETHAASAPKTPAHRAGERGHRRGGRPHRTRGTTRDHRRTRRRPRRTRRDALEQLCADSIGAIEATSAPANGLFAGLPYALGISGGFAAPFAADLLPQADLVLVFGASVNHWTTKHGALISPNAKVIQIDVEAKAIGRNRPADLAILGDADATAIALATELNARGHKNTGFRTPELATQIKNQTWANEPYDDASTDEWIDPRTLSIKLNELLPRDKAVAVDSGHFLGYPSMFFDVPDANAWIFPNGFQAVGLGLGNAIGAAIARPDRTTVAAIGDGGAFMALAEIETAARLHLGNLLILIYDDNAYGAEVHHFAPMGHDVSLVRFPDADLAAMAQAAGARAQTVRNESDLSIVEEWLAEQFGHPLVLDAKVNPTIVAEWLEEAFRAG